MTLSFKESLEKEVVGKCIRYEIGLNNEIGSKKRE